MKVVAAGEQGREERLHDHGHVFNCFSWHYTKPFFMRLKSTRNRATRGSRSDIFRQFSGTILIKLKHPLAFYIIKLIQEIDFFCVCACVRVNTHSGSGNRREACGKGLTRQQVWVVSGWGPLQMSLKWGWSERDVVHRVQLPSSLHNIIYTYKKKIKKMHQTSPPSIWHFGIRTYYA